VKGNEPILRRSRPADQALSTALVVERIERLLPSGRRIRWAVIARGDHVP